MNVVSKIRPIMSVEEFLAWPGDGTCTRFELVNGQPRAMAPASTVHGIIQGNIVRHLGNHLAPTACSVAAEAGIKPVFDARRNVRIPDITVTCSEATPRDHLVSEPLLIVEILSPSNEDDTWESITALATVASLREIVVVQSERMEALVYTRLSDNNWPEQGVTVPADGVVRLSSIDAELKMSDIYLKTGLS
ncbi:MAG: Uma2 family endonuclease [Hyphomicrobiaceae bacterium]|nr:Uma2 family endonuclease [Hyphomicrobiaceae bacterium]